MSRKSPPGTSIAFDLALLTADIRQLSTRRETLREEERSRIFDPQDGRDTRVDRDQQQDGRPARAEAARKHGERAGR